MTASLIYDDAGGIIVLDVTAVSGSPTVSVTSPNGGESWRIKTAQTITWTSSLLTDNVDILLSTDGGATFPHVLAADIANTGSYSLAASANAYAGTQIRIRVQRANAAGGPPPSDASNANFRVVPDLDGDGDVDMLDVSTLLAGLGGMASGLDLNNDGLVNMADIALMIEQFGVTYP